MSSGVGDGKGVMVIVGWALAGVQRVISKWKGGEVIEKTLDRYAAGWLGSGLESTLQFKSREGSVWRRRGQLHMPHVNTPI